MKTLTVDDSNYYKYLIKEGNKTQEINYILEVERKYDRLKY